MATEPVVTGITEVDGEHAFQARLLEAIAELLARGDADPEEKAKAVGQLVDYTSVHFLSEELLMRLYAYPQYGAHASEHARLMDRVRELRAAHEAGSDAAGPTLVDELRDWLQGHLRGPDLAFASWCEKNAIRPG